MQQRRLLHSQRPGPQAPAPSAPSSLALSGAQAGEALAAEGTAGHAGGQRDRVDVAVSSSDDDGGHDRVQGVAAHDSDPTCGEAAIDWDALRDQVDDHVAQVLPPPCPLLVMIPFGNKWTASTQLKGKRVVDEFGLLSLRADTPACCCRDKRCRTL